MLLHEKSPIYKLGITKGSEFNKPFIYVKATNSTQENVVHKIGVLKLNKRGSKIKEKH